MKPHSDAIFFLHVVRSKLQKVQPKLQPKLQPTSLRSDKWRRDAVFGLTMIHLSVTSGTLVDFPAKNGVITRFVLYLPIF